jgi:parvulin-like peptidyl-prolyl isomerase
MKPATLEMLSLTAAGAQHQMCVGLLFAVLACASCSNSSTDTVLRAGDITVTAAEVERALSTEPVQVRRRFSSSLAEKRRYVERLGREKLLVAEARRLKLDEDPLLERRVRQLLAERLVEKLRAELAPASITDDEIARYYAAHRDDFERPAATQVSLLVLATRAEADALRAELERLAGGARFDRFRELASRRSLDPASRGRGGDLGYVSVGTTGVAPAFASAAAALVRAGDLSAPLAVNRGFAILLKTGERPGYRRDPARARELIRQRLLAERRANVVEDAVRRLGWEQPQIEASALESLHAMDGRL